MAVGGKRGYHMILPGSLFDEEVGVSCRGGLPAWALVEYVSSVESREAMETNQLQRSFSIQLENVCIMWYWIDIIMSCLTLIIVCAQYLKRGWRSCLSQSFQLERTSLTQSRPEEVVSSIPSRNTHTQTSQTSVVILMLTCTHKPHFCSKCTKYN